MAIFISIFLRNVAVQVIILYGDLETYGSRTVSYAMLFARLICRISDEVPSNVKCGQFVRIICSPIVYADVT